jgi:hypothetical protein
MPLGVSSTVNEYSFSPLLTTLRASIIFIMFCAGGHGTASFSIHHRAAAAFAFILGISATPTTTRQIPDPSRWCRKTWMMRTTRKKGGKDDGGRTGGVTMAGEGAREEKGEEPCRTRWGVYQAQLLFVASRTTCWHRYGGTTTFQNTARRKANATSK